MLQPGRNNPMEVPIVSWSHMQHCHKIGFQLMCQLHFMGKQLLSQELGVAPKILVVPKVSQCKALLAYQVMALVRVLVGRRNLMRWQVRRLV